LRKRFPQVAEISAIPEKNLKRIKCLGSGSAVFKSIEQSSEIKHLGHIHFRNPKRNRACKPLICRDLQNWLRKGFVGDCGRKRCGLSLSCPGALALFELVVVPALRTAESGLWADFFPAVVALPHRSQTKALCGHTSHRNGSVARHFLVVGGLVGQISQGAPPLPSCA